MKVAVGSIGLWLFLLFSPTAFSSKSSNNDKCSSSFTNVATNSEKVELETLTKEFFIQHLRMPTNKEVISESLPSSSWIISAGEENVLDEKASLELLLSTFPRLKSRGKARMEYLASSLKEEHTFISSIESQILKVYERFLKDEQIPSSHDVSSEINMELAEFQLLFGKDGLLLDRRNYQLKFYAHNKKAKQLLLDNIYQVQKESFLKDYEFKDLAGISNESDISKEVIKRIAPEYSGKTELIDAQSVKLITDTEKGRIERTLVDAYKKVLSSGRLISEAQMAQELFIHEKSYSRFFGQDGLLFSSSALISSAIEELGRFELLAEQVIIYQKQQIFSEWKILSPKEVEKGLNLKEVWLRNKYMSEWFKEDDSWLESMSKELKKDKKLINELRKSVISTAYNIIQNYKELPTPERISSLLGVKESDFSQAFGYQGNLIPFSSYFSGMVNQHKLLSRSDIGPLILEQVNNFVLEQMKLALVPPTLLSLSEKLGLSKSQLKTLIPELGSVRSRFDYYVSLLQTSENDVLESEIFDRLILFYSDLAYEQRLLPTVAELSVYIQEKTGIFVPAESFTRLYGKNGSLFPKDLYHSVAKRRDLNGPQRFRHVSSPAFSDPERSERIFAEIRKHKNMIVTGAVSGANTNSDNFRAIEDLLLLAKDKDAIVVVGVLEGLNALVIDRLEELSEEGQIFLLGEGVYEIDPYLTIHNPGTLAKVQNHTATFDKLHHPTEGVHIYISPRSSIVTAPTEKDSQVRASQTVQTGVMTLANYDSPALSKQVSKRTNYIAEALHTYGAVMVQLDWSDISSLPERRSVPVHHAHLLGYDLEGQAFNYMGKRYSQNGVENIEYLAVKFGDYHLVQMNQKYIPTILSFIKKHKVKYLVVGDGIDGYSVNHWLKGYSKAEQKRYFSGLDIPTEANHARAFYEILLRECPWLTIIEEDANHPLWFARYIKEKWFMDDSINQDIAFVLGKAMNEGWTNPVEYLIKAGIPGKVTPISADLRDRLVYPNTGEGFFTLKNLELGEKLRQITFHHGHIGRNPFKGSPSDKELVKYINGSISGHTHSLGSFFLTNKKAVVVVGHMLIPQEYGKKTLYSGLGASFAAITEDLFVEYFSDAQGSFRFQTPETDKSVASERFPKGYPRGSDFNLTPRNQADGGLGGGVDWYFSGRSKSKGDPKKEK